jgi:hypothetical protein
MKSSTKGTRILQAYSGASMHLLSFSTRNAIAKLAQVHGLSKKGGFALKSSTLLSPHPVAVTCRRYGIARSLLSVEEKVQPQKPPKPGRIDPEDPKRSGSLSGPQSLWNGFKDSGRNSPSWGRQSSPSSSRKRVSPFLLPRWGESSNPSKPGVF